MAGPIWSAPTVDTDFVRGLLDSVKSDECTLGTRKRIVGMLSLIMEELADVVLFHDLPLMTRTLKTPMLKHSLMTSALYSAAWEMRPFVMILPAI
jgi:tRNA G26 N,N-dimethylase Trm1